MKQTAVEWFWIHLPENISKEYFDLFEQAKELEKQQIIDACKDANGTYFLCEYESYEQYYNEKFKNK